MRLGLETNGVEGDRSDKALVRGHWDWLNKGTGHGMRNLGMETGIE